MIRIWERTEDLPGIALDTSLPWTCTQEIGLDHRAPVWRVSWADPEFGEIIASCGNDKHICIYREKENTDRSTENVATL
jgi:hypothetical protein